MKKEKIDKIEGQIKRLEERKKAILRKEKEAKRKEDTRFKIIIGGALLAGAEKSDNPNKDAYARILNLCLEYNILDKEKDWLLKHFHENYSDKINEK
jgi:hypothetical protein